MWHPPGGMRPPDRGSTTGNASWTDREPASGLPRRGELSESIPPPPPYFKKSSYASTGFFFACGTHRGDETPRPGFDNWQRQLDRPQACERAAPQGRAKRVNPPLTAIFEMRACTQVRALFFYILRWGGMRTPDRGSTTGNASWTDRKPASGLPRRGERSESIPPSPPYFKKSSYASTGFFSHVAPQTSPGSASMPLPGYQTVSAR